MTNKVSEEMVRSGNFSDTGIHGNNERFLWISYLVTVFLTSFIGDSIILVSTIKYKAIKLHRVVVVVIQHLAVNDLLLTMFLILPQIVSLIVEDWVLGLFLCHMTENIGYVCNFVTGSLTCVLIVNKFLVIVHPLRSVIWTRRRVHVVCFLFWTLGIIQPNQIINMFFTGPESIFFDYYDYACDYDSSLTRAPAVLKVLTQITTVLGLVVISIVLLSTSALLLITARNVAVRRGECLRWQGVLTVSLTIAVFLISWLPYLVVQTTDKLASVQYSIETKRAVRFLLYLNVMANFFIYSLTVRSFRKFLRSRIKMLMFAIKFRKYEKEEASPHMGGVTCQYTLTNLNEQQNYGCDRIQETSV